MATLLSTKAGNLTAHHHLSLPKRPPSLPPTTTLHFSASKRTSHVANARRQGGLSSRTRRLEKREKRGEKKGGSSVVKEEEEGEDGGDYEERVVAVEIDGGGMMEYSTEPMPKQEGLEPDFWEGPQWDAFGFFIQYLWAFGILFGLISGGIAVATYNEGATDFKQTPAFKESMQSRELLEEPDASTADVFEANPTESAPSLE